MTDFQISRIVEFIDSGVLKLGLVQGDAKGKLQVRDQNGRQHSVAPKHVLISHPAPEDSSDWPGSAQRLLEKIAEKEEEIDVELLWQSVQGEADEFSPAELSEIYFGQSNAVNESAILRVVRAGDTFFRLRAGRITPRTESQVEQMLHSVRKQREKEDFRLRAQTWFEDLLAGSAEIDEELTEEQELIVRRLNDFVKNQHDEEVGRILASTSSDQSPRVDALEILRVLGRLPEQADPSLLAAGIKLEFSSSALRESAQLQPFQPGSSRFQIESPVLFTIDDAETEEIDDAISIRMDENGTLVGIHIADVAHFIDKGTALDAEAYGRKSTIYLPQQEVRMFPDRVGCELASLNAARVRPAMSFLLRFDTADELIDWEIRRTELEVRDRLTYESADMLLSPETATPIARALQYLDRLTLRKLKERKARGALTLQRPELKISVKEDGIHVDVCDNQSPSRRIVSELMILANSLAAKLAVEENIPFIFRSQPPPKGDIQEPLGYDPVALSEIFSKLERSKLSIYPQKHSGLGLDAYTQITSPIRRYLDLVLQRQLTARITDQHLPYQLQEIMEILGTVQSAEADLRGAERNANRLYLLRYLAQRQDNGNLEAIVLKPVSNGYLVETTDLYARAFLKTPLDYIVGEILPVKIAKINPDKNVFILAEA
ncbi:MAG: RNB domain-containing ribonuclease [Acidobacteriota bacterium]|nr:MAG: RNB domain-containing ribonuclease [Acidobacteriota bacterium]